MRERDNIMRERERHCERYDNIMREREIHSIIYDKIMRERWRDTER